MTLRVLVLSLLLCAPTAGGQSAAASEYFSSAQVHDGVAGAAQAAGQTAARLLSNRGHYLSVVVRRDRTGDVEMHELWDDVMVVQEGTGTLVYGGQLEGGREAQPGENGAGPGEWRGGTVSNGMEQQLGVGDLAIVPAGVPHQVRVDPGGSITYLIIKIAPVAASVAGNH